jgi:acetate kinase
MHLNRVIKKDDLDMFYVAGPGHGGPAIVGSVYLEGTWSEVYLMHETKFDAAMLEELVDHRSGLLEISGIGNDMRRLHETASSNADGRLAIEMFCYPVRKDVAAMAAALDGVDFLVFTGGVGENNAKARAGSAAACRGSASAWTRYTTAPRPIPSAPPHRAVPCAS